MSKARLYRSLLLGMGATAAACVTTVSAQQSSAPSRPSTTGVPTSSATSVTSVTSATGAGAAVPPRMVTPVVLPGTRASAFSNIQGNALDANNTGLPHSLVRLRDARRGHIVDTQTTDRGGLFAFRQVDPGSYVVELLAVDRRVAAASELLSVNAGDAVSTVVKLPSRKPLPGWLSQALAVTSAAAASGVLATGVTGEHVSPQQ